MRNSKQTTRFFVLVAALTTGTTACGSYGDPCLRSTDCGSGFVCVEGACVIDLGDNPSDAAVGDAPGASDAPSSGDPATSDANRDASSEEASTPAADSASPDTTLDIASDGDAADISVLDAPRDTADAALPTEADVQAATDSGSGSNDAVSADVGDDADSSMVREAEDAADALAATG